MLLLSIFGLHDKFSYAHKPLPNIFALHAIIIYVCELISTTSTSPIALICGYVLPLVTYVSPFSLPLGFVPLQEIYELCIAAPRTLFLIQGPYVHHAKTDSAGQHQT